MGASDRELASTTKRLAESGVEDNRDGEGDASDAAAVFERPDVKGLDRLRCFDAPLRERVMKDNNCVEIPEKRVFVGPGPVQRVTLVLLESVPEHASCDLADAEVRYGRRCG